jgi:AAA15 family ATPase/GTPase
LIWLLIQNGTLLSGSVLFWDEPEANLNPALMGEVVEVILELQRLGVQVFLTTHNYVLLKEFDLRKQSHDQIRYLSLFRDESEAVVAKASDSYLGVAPNAIAATFSSLYDRELKRSLGGFKS